MEVGERIPDIKREDLKHAKGCGHHYVQYTRVKVYSRGLFQRHEFEDAYWHCLNCGVKTGTFKTRTK